MRCQSGLISPAPLLIVVITSAGAYTAAPTAAPTPAPIPSIAAPSTAPEAAPSAIPQTAASRSWPEGLRLRRSGSAIPGSIAAADNRDQGDLLGASVKRRRPFARATATIAIDSPASTGEAFAR